ncbi:unnamed protein product [Closterium sp. Naga37s-1]|nr:unnamed protein product [Closterium sp. Naga37s-1]
MAGDTRLTQPRSFSDPAAGNAPNTAPRNAAPIPAAELPPPSFHVDVAIAGGGLAGLALAAGLQSRGVEAAVFEAAPALRSSNSTVLVIWPNGAAALDGILPGLSASVARHGTLPRGGGEAEAGETGGTGGAGEAGEAGRAWEAGGVRGAVGLGEGSEESGRSEVEAVNVVCEVAGSNPGEKQLVVVRAKVLVGADGVRSALRYVDYEMDPTLQGTPFAGFGSKHNIKARLLPLIQTNLPHHPLWERAFQEASSTPENLIFERRQLDRPPPADSWSDPVCGNRVVLIGDAAHAMDPGPGQGALTGFEDAHQLSLCLGEAGDPDLLTKPAAVAAAVREFEARRIARCVKVHRHATGLIGYGEEGREFKSRSVEHQMKASMELTRWMYSYPDKIDGDPESNFFK